MRADLSPRALAGAALVALVVAASLLTSPDAVLVHVEALAADPLLFGAALVVLYSVRPLVAWPTTLVAVVVGYGYGVALGVPIGLAGAVYTSMPPFFAARWVDDGGPIPVLDRLSAVGRFRTSAERYFDTAGGVRGVTAARLAPIPADAVTCTASVSGVRLRHFVAGTLVGELPWTVAAVVVGSSANTLTTHGLGAIGLPLAVAMVVSAAVLLAGPAYETFAHSSE
ncbi:TVP38/TMEM64 family protein [Haloarchaeobius amylolyticus]|uniref:TVP38/TMEM64 family protein n=1 Tax=Haloarchaeobius amylolyticus TaxID=1198296 RepID=UPI00227040C0|nr:VTT domain-containing protein [Haloarchaeobius amylolyticus]